PSVHGAEESTDIAAPLEKIDPEPSVALGFPFGGHADSRGALQEIRGAERGHEPVQLSVPLDAPEALRGAQQTEPDPPPPHITIAPALDVPRDVPHRADQILDAVRRCEEAPQRRGQPQLQHRQRFLQPLPHTGGGIGMTVPLQPRRQRLQLPPRRRRTGRPIRPPQARPDVGLAWLRDEGVEVTRLVELAALNDRGSPKTSPSALRSPLPSSITHSTRPSSVR